MTRYLQAAGIVLGFAWVPVAPAQAAAPAAPITAPQTIDFTDADLKSFAVAVIHVSQINDTYLPVYQAAKTPEEQQLVEQKATDEMVQAVKKQGMSVEKYQQILTHAKSNPQVANRVDQLIKEMASGNSSVGR
jgi:thiamine biosynthesis protein ThiC